MKQLFKKYFIPHAENEYQPHILRFEVALLILSGFLFLEIVFLVSTFVLYPRVRFLGTIVANVLVDETNANRAADNLAPLLVNPLLVAAAQLKANDMATNGYFAHTSPQGLSPWYWLEKSGYQFDYAGENLAVNFFDSADVTNAWMNSPAHRENILNSHFSDIGIAAARGTYKGHDTLFVVEFFGHTPALRASAPEEERTVPTIAATISAPPKEAATGTKVLSQSQTFIAVEGASIASSGAATSSVASETVPQAAVGATSFLVRILLSPRAMMNYLFFMFFTIILLALVLKIFIRIDKQYPALIANGVLLLIVIASVLLVNQYLSFSQIQVF